MKLNISEATEEARKQGVKVVRNPSNEQVESLQKAIIASKIDTTKVDGWFILQTKYDGILVKSGSGKKYIGINSNMLNNPFAVFQIMHEMSHVKAGFKHDVLFVKYFMDQIADYCDFKKKED